jgi:hypothetical protein
VLQANVDLCKENRAYSHGIGYTWVRPADGQHQQVSARANRTQPGATIIKVYPPASDQNLRAGDRIASVGAHSVADSDESGRLVAAAFRTTVEKGTPLELGILRGEQQFKVRISPAPRCPGSLEIITDPKVNAFADGTNVSVTTGMLDFVKSDDELALILGHEIAHNIYKHGWPQSSPRSVGVLLGLLFTAAAGTDMSKAGSEVGGVMFNHEFEAEADYVGTYLAARAGYDVRAAAALWRRIASFHPSAIHASPLSIGPNGAWRFLVVEQAAEEVEAKRNAAEPVLPSVNRRAAAPR